MKSIFRYPGGKTKAAIQQWILAHRPHGIREYREPFVGGGGVFFGIHPSSVEKRWINDKHVGLIEVYAALRNRPEGFAEACRAIAPARVDDPLTESGPRGGKRTNARLKDVFDSLKLNEECDQALRYFFVNRTVHGSGRVNYDIPSRLYFSNPEGWNIVNGDELEAAGRHVAGARITCGDYEQLFADPGEGVWIYADPPYAVNTALTRTSQLYQHSFTNADHERFAKVVADCQHNVCISYDDDGEGFVRSLFPETQFRLIEASWNYCGTTNDKKDAGKELLILNYDPPSHSVAVPESFQIETGLTKPEVDLLAECEAKIDHAAKSFVEAGEALRIIRDSGRPSERLYRANYATFEDYCMGRWGFTKDYGNKLIRAFETYATLKTNTLVSILPQRETHVRPLLKLESDQDRIDIWQKVVEQAGGDPKRITASAVTELVNEAIGYEPPEKDYFKALARAWASADEETRNRFIKEFIERTAAA